MRGDSVAPPGYAVPGYSAGRQAQFCRAPGNSIRCFPDTGTCRKRQCCKWVPDKALAIWLPSLQRTWPDFERWITGISPESKPKTLDSLRPRCLMYEDEACALRAQLLSHVECLSRSAELEGGSGAANACLMCRLVGQSPDCALTISTGCCPLFRSKTVALERRLHCIAFSRWRSLCVHSSIFAVSSSESLEPG